MQKYNWGTILCNWDCWILTNAIYSTLISQEFGQHRFLDRVALEWDNDEGLSTFMPQNNQLARWTALRIWEPFLLRQQSICSEKQVLIKHVWRVIRYLSNYHDIFSQKVILSAKIEYTKGMLRSMNCRKSLPSTNQRSLSEAFEVSFHCGSQHGHDQDMLAL